MIHLATRRIRNIDRIPEEIGELIFLVPCVVLDELKYMSKHNATKRADAKQTLSYIEKFTTISIGESGTVSADDAIISYAQKHDGNITVATMDRHLKQILVGYGCAIMSFSNDNVVLESHV